MGYVQYDLTSFSPNFEFHTVHKPCKRCGTGFQVWTDVKKPEVRAAIDTFILAPAWAKSDEAFVKKYASLQEYLALNTILVKDVIRA